MNVRLGGLEKGRSALALALLAVLFAAIAGPASRAQAETYAALFGTAERRNADISQFPKWIGAMKRYDREQALEDKPCAPGKSCALQKWKGFLQGLRGRDRLAQLHAVNAYVNRVPYKSDQENYAVNDYWATPREFFAREGDCEDYAIAKYISLRHLGWKASDLRLAVVQDEQQRILHAVLIAYHKGTAYILDNQIKPVVEHRTVGHYRPIFSINEQAWWFHSGFVAYRTTAPGHVNVSAPAPVRARPGRSYAANDNERVSGIFTNAGRR